MSRSMFLAAGAAAVLIGLVFVFVNPFEDQIRKGNPERGALLSFDYDKVDGIEVRAQSETIALTRGSQGWVVTSKGNFPADTMAVAAVLEALSDAQRSSVISRNPEKRSRFEVDEQAGVRVILTAQGQTVADLVVGKPGADFTTSYVQVYGEDDVVQVRGLNRNLFNRGRGYRDRALTRFNPQAVTSFTWAAADTGWTMTRQDSLWAITSPDGTSGTISEQTATGPLRAISVLTADGFAQETAETGLDRPTYALTIEFQNGDTTSISVGNQEGSQFYVTRSDRDAVYFLSEWNLSQLRKQAWDFLSEE